MSKCGKGCMPECEYFTTGGCISPFNCQYKIETGYINSATSIPTYMEKQMSMTAEEIEHCLERFTMGKTTDVMNFDYAGTLAYIQRLKAENAALKERLEKAVELPCKVGDKVYCIHGMSNPEMLEWQVNGIRITDHNYMLQLGRAGTKDYRNEASQFYGKWWFVTREAAEARLAELKGEKK